MKQIEVLDELAKKIEEFRDMEYEEFLSEENQLLEAMCFLTTNIIYYNTDDAGKELAINTMYLLTRYYDLMETMRMKMD